MTTFDPESLIAILAWLGGACFCGFLPMGFAAILFFTARKRNAVGGALAAARAGSTSSLGPGSGLVRLQGRIAPHARPIDGPEENGLVYLRMKVEIYDTDAGQDRSSWRGLTDKAHAVPFQLDDGSGPAWVLPDGLDKQLIGDGFVPDDNQIQSACTLLGIDPDILRGQLRFRMWEFRVGQTLTVIGSVIPSGDGFAVGRAKDQPLVISPLLGAAVGTTVQAQTKKASVWMLVLGIPGVLFLLCGVGGALWRLITLLGGE